MKKSLILATIALIFCLCYSCQQVRYIPVETTKTEYRDKFHRDSVYLYDSVYVKEKGDTQSCSEEIQNPYNQKYQNSLQISD